MKTLLSAAVAAVVLSVSLPNISMAESASSEAGVEATLADLQRRIAELEARVGGKSITAFRGRSRAAGYVTQPTVAANPE